MWFGWSTWMTSLWKYTWSTSGVFPESLFLRSQPIEEHKGPLFFSNIQHRQTILSQELLPAIRKSTRMLPMLDLVHASNRIFKNGVHCVSLTAWIIFHKLTIIPSINPTSSSTFPNKPLFCQSLSSTKLESLFKYRPARLSSTPSQFTDRGLFHIVHWQHLLKLCRSQTSLN
jgi:hypothetical protein